MCSMVCHRPSMDSIWQQLPDEISEHICNQLPKVRRIPMDLSGDIQNQFFMLSRLRRNYTSWYGRDDGYDVLLDDLNMLNETDYINIYDAWYDIDRDRRREYYYSVFDPF